MLDTIQWWHWIVLGAALLATDIAFINVYYLIWFGLGALAAGGALLLFPAMPFWGQLAVMVIVTGSTLAYWIYVLRPAKDKRRLAAARDQLIGAMAVVVRFSCGRGELRLQRPIGDRDVWRFSSQHAPAAGDTVRVCAVHEDDTLQAEPPAHAPN